MKMTFFKAVAEFPMRDKKPGTELFYVGTGSWPLTKNFLNSKVYPTVKAADKALASLSKNYEGCIRTYVLPFELEYDTLNDTDQMREFVAESMRYPHSSSNNKTEFTVTP
jgi:hypothetical protein